jgi:hypothetical protein
MTMNGHELVQPAHHGVAVRWAATMPEDIRKLFRPYVLYIARHAPSWLQTLHVQLCDDMPNASLQVSLTTHYNSATLSVYAGWFAQPKDLRRQDTLHELVHLYTARLDTYVRLVRGSEPPALASLHEKLYKEADESMTEALAVLLVQFLPELEIGD